MNSSMEAEFRAVLGRMAGTKESIRKAKEWMFERPGKVSQMAETLRAHVVEAAREERFSAVLFAIYLLNDVFFNSTHDDPFRAGCLASLPTIVRVACDAAPSDGDREKILRVVNLWGSKQVFSADTIGTLRSAAADKPKSSGFSAPAPAPPREEAEATRKASAEREEETTTKDTAAAAETKAPSSFNTQAALEAAKLMTASFGSTKKLGFAPSSGVAPSTTSAVPMGLQPSTSPPFVGFATGVPTPAPLCDLAAIPVGIMAGLVKGALRNGHEPWKPLDVASMPSLMPPPVEPGRLEARVSEFYRVMEKNRLKRQRADDENDGGAPPRAFKLPEVVLPGQNDDARARRRFDGIRMPQLDPAVAQSSSSSSSEPAAPADDKQRPIGDDNLGKQMLRGMGWQEGRGLGLAGRGRADPIADAGQTDTIGIGSRNDPPPDLTDAFAQYRAQRSSGYKARWNA